MKIPRQIERELGALTKSESYKSLRAYWYLRLAEVAWQLTGAPANQVELLQGQANELKLQIQQITMLTVDVDMNETIFNDPADKQEAKAKESAQRLKDENATMEIEVKDNIIDKAESSIDT